jgi:outer membrane lipoprotein-sorting protein
VPRDGIVLNPSVLKEHYLTTLAVRDTLDGKIMFKLLLAAKNATTRLRALSLWVDPANWTITKMETVPYEERTLSMVFTYEYQNEKYWLPSKMVASFTSESDKGQKNTSPSIDNQFEGAQRSAPRSGKVTIVYSNYKINIGLSDEIFEKKEK